MKTQHALLSTTIMCPLRSTATPLGPIRRPAPILVWGGRHKGMCQLQGITTWMSAPEAGAANCLLADVATAGTLHTALDIIWGGGHIRGLDSLDPEGTAADGLPIEAYGEDVVAFLARRVEQFVSAILVVLHLVLQGTVVGCRHLSLQAGTAIADQLPILVLGGDGQRGGLAHHRMAEAFTCRHCLVGNGAGGEQHAKIQDGLAHALRLHHGLLGEAAAAEDVLLALAQDFQLGLQHLSQGRRGSALPSQDPPGAGWGDGHPLAAQEQCSWSQGTESLSTMCLLKLGEERRSGAARTLEKTPPKFSGFTFCLAPQRASRSRTSSPLRCPSAFSSSVKVLPISATASFLRSASC
ncbi:hypothetical protein E2320_005736 [Naja naja]|nr:hypothetical protein E2320_005736 [Naja naja]